MTTEIHGFCDVRFAPIRDAFAQNFEDGLELGATLAMTWRGRLVAELWAGFADKERTRPWEKDTLCPVASTTKILMMIAAALVIDRGLLDLDAPVARYWPEFAQGGKENVTVREALTHQAGVPGFVTPLTNAEFCDWDKACARLAAEPHWFRGERQICYHFHTYGHLIGELIRRVDGRRPRQFIHEEINAKVGGEFHIGGTPDLIPRVCGLNLPEGAFQGEGMLKRMIDSVDMSVAARMSWERLSGDLPSGNGYTNGRGIALAGAIIAHGGVADGLRLLSPETIALAGREHAYGPDPYLGMIRYGLGFGLHSKEFPAPTPTSMHWGGYGGSWGWMDPASGLSLGYAPNNWVVPDSSTGQIALDGRLHRFMTALSAISAAM
jgi:CubicO group peptidase (beta-lactamase class C family)